MKRISSLLLLINYFWCSSMAASDGDDDTRIVGGSPAALGEFPYQGLLTAEKHICGCSLIFPKWAITAAHCTDNVSTDKLKIKFATTKQSENSAYMYSVRSVFNHPQYSCSSDGVPVHDISLLQLSSDVPYTFHLVYPIELPDQEEQAEIGKRCSITGWGKLNENSDEGSETLQKAEVPIMSTSVCNDLYSTLVEPKVIVGAEQVCAGYQAGEVDACCGDSGGPLACSSASGTPVLQGVTSFGEGCAKSGRPGVYTRVSMYVEWIEDTIKTNGSNQKSFSLGLMMVLSLVTLLFSNL